MIWQAAPGSSGGRAAARRNARAAAAARRAVGNSASELRSRHEPARRRARPALPLRPRPRGLPGSGAPPIVRLVQHALPPERATSVAPSARWPDDLGRRARRCSAGVSVSARACASPAVRMRKLPIGRAELTGFPRTFQARRAASDAPGGRSSSPRRAQVPARRRARVPRRKLPQRKRRRPVPGGFQTRARTSRFREGQFVLTGQRASKLKKYSSKGAPGSRRCGRKPGVEVGRVTLAQTRGDAALDPAWWRAASGPAGNFRPPPGRCPPSTRQRSAHSLGYSSRVNSAGSRDTPANASGPVQFSNTSRKRKCSSWACPTT